MNDENTLRSQADDEETREREAPKPVEEIELDLDLDLDLEEESVMRGPESWREIADTLADPIEP